MPVLEALLNSSDVTIYTSVISKIEVSFGEVEKTRQQAVPEIAAQIDALWSDPDSIRLVDFHDVIGQLGLFP